MLAARCSSASAGGALRLHASVTSCFLCAEEYEPPGFRGVEEESLGYFARRPFSMDVGTVTTPYHGIVLRVRPAPLEAPTARSLHPTLASTADAGQMQSNSLARGGAYTGNEWQ